MKNIIKNEFKTAIILKNKIVLAPDRNENHSDLLKSFGIEDNFDNQSTRFVKVQLIPKDNNKATDVNEWTYKVNQYITPAWYEENRKKYEEDFREKVKEHLKNRFEIFANVPWVKIKTDGDKIYYLYDGIFDYSIFGDDESYADSIVRKKLNNSELAKKLKKELGDKLVPITTDIFTPHVVTYNYRDIKEDILAIPNIVLFKECHKNITEIDKNEWWWLSSFKVTDYHRYVRCVRDNWENFKIYSLEAGIRPFFILRS